MGCSTTPTSIDSEKLDPIKKALWPAIAKLPNHTYTSDKVHYVFICGLTHNYPSLTIQERKSLIWDLWAKYTHRKNVKIKKQYVNNAGPFTPKNKPKKKLTLPTKGSNVQTKTARTQKARGIAVLSGYYKFQTPGYILVQEENEIDNIDLSMFYDNDRVFVRPCPITPKHGFVDSQFVELNKSISNAIDDLFSPQQQIRRIFKEAKRVDPDAEVIVMEPVDARINMIYTPGMMTIGPSNDGATSGINSISIPNVSTTTSSQALAEKAGVAEGDAAYFELLQPQGQHALRWVQLRGGPKVVGNTSPDFVPNTITVEHVVKATGDLIEWAETVKTFKPNTAVDHTGGNPLSHYFVHCRLHNIPILTTRTPQVGETLEAIEDKTPPPNYSAFCTGIVVGSMAKPHELPSLPAGENISLFNVANAMLYGLHNSTVLTGDYSFWLGVSIAYMSRLGAAASVGEWRHRNKAIGTDRNQVYYNCFQKYWLNRRRLTKCFNSFTGHDGSEWKGGFGGMKWADCTYSVIELDNAICSMMRATTEEEKSQAYVKLIDQFNISVNKAHNNGWWMNKFCDMSAFNGHAKGDFYYQVNAAPEYWTAYKTLINCPKTLAKEMKKWKAIKNLLINDDAKKRYDLYLATGAYANNKNECEDEDDGGHHDEECMCNYCNNLSPVLSYEITYPTSELDKVCPQIKTNLLGKHNNGNALAHIQFKCVDKETNGNPQYVGINVNIDSDLAAWVEKAQGNSTSFAPKSESAYLKLEAKKHTGTIEGVKNPIAFMHGSVVVCYVKHKPSKQMTKGFAEVLAYKGEPTINPNTTVNPVCGSVGCTLCGPEKSLINPTCGLHCDEKHND